MRYSKGLGLLTVVAFLAVASAASATTITSSTGATPTIKALSSKTEMHWVSLGVTISCTESVIEGVIESHGAGKAASGKISNLKFENCNNHMTVFKKGTLSITGTATTGNGTVTLSGTELTLQNTAVGISCVYTTNNTLFGTLTGGTHAVLDVQAAIIPRTGHSAFCGTSGEWTGTYTVTQPTDLTVH